MRYTGDGMKLAASKPATDAEPQRVRFTVAEYFRIADEGLLADARTELMDGEILGIPPQKNDHAYSVSMLVRTLDRMVGDRLWVRGQATLQIGHVAAPEPDVAVVAGPPRPGDDVPNAALFVAEVSDATLRYDRTTKMSLYASAGVPEYWVINLVDRRVEIHRDPVEDSPARFGWRYARIESVGRDALLPVPASLGAAGQIPAADLLP